LSANVFS
jgi:hypothetical protein